jgi:hypothetical protein
MHDLLISMVTWLIIVLIFYIVWCVTHSYYALAAIPLIYIVLLMLGSIPMKGHNWIENYLGVYLLMPMITFIYFINRLKGSSCGLGCGALPDGHCDCI